MSGCGDCELLFVYGSLRSSSTHAMARVLAENATLLGQGVLQAELLQISWYPGAVLSPDPASAVSGEVYRLKHTAGFLPQLDRYEECGSEFPQPWEFIRQCCPIRMADGTTLSCWVYLYNSDRLVTANCDGVVPANSTGGL